MNCPHCKKELVIGCESKASQKCVHVMEGERILITYYGMVDVQETLGWFCWHCGKDLPESITKKIEG